MSYFISRKSSTKREYIEPRADILSKKQKLQVIPMANLEEGLVNKRIGSDVNGHRKTPMMLRLLFGSLFLIAILSMLSLLHMFPFRPVTLIGWLILIGICPALWIFGEAISDLWLRLGERLTVRIEARHISSLRLLVLLVQTLIFILVFGAMVFLLWQAFGSYIEPHFATFW